MNLFVHTRHPDHRGIRLFSTLVFAVTVFGLGHWAKGEEPFPPHGELTLLQINDVYSTTPVDGGKAGGLARVAALVKRTREQASQVEVIIAGDFLSPSVASGVFQGRQMVAALNAAGITLAILGNHEFDFGADVLRERMKEARWQWVNANVLDAQTGRPLADTPPYLLRKYGSLTVGYFGLCLASEEISRDKLRGLKITDPFAAAAQYLPLIRRDGANVIVAITHLNYADDLKLARLYPDIDLIIGGHEHIPIATAVERTFISKAGSDARFVARLDLGRTHSVLEKNYALLPVTPDLPEDPEAARVVADYEQQLGAALDVAVGSTRVDLDAVAHRVRAAESNLGNFIADALREDVAADVGLMNSGSIRGDRVFPAGPLKRRDLVAIQPFGGIICKVELSGRTLLAALNHGVARVSERLGRFPQVSGIAFEVELSAPPGDRVRQVVIGQRPLDLALTYSVAITDYVLKGGDGYSMFDTNKVLIDPAHGNLLVNVLENRVRALKEIDPKVEGRIRMVHQEPIR